MISRRIPEADVRAATNLLNNSSSAAGKFSFCSLDHGDAERMAEALKVNAKVTDFKMCISSRGGADRTSAGFAAMADVLTVNTVLTRLTLRSGYPEVATAAAVAVAKALGSNTTLTHLEIGNCVGKEGVEAIADALATRRNTTLTSLNLCPKFVWDDQHDGFLGEEGGPVIERLVGTGTLTCLDLFKFHLYPEVVVCLSRALSVSRTMKSLCLRNTVIGPAETEHLAHALAVNGALKNLDLSENKIGAEGAAHLSRALVHNATLENLKLGKNSIGNAGATHIASALAQNSTLTALELFHNSITAEGRKSIAAALTKNTSLKTLYIVDEVYIFSEEYYDYDDISATIRGTKACIPLRKSQRMAFLGGYFGKGDCDIKILPLDVIRRILKCYRVEQGIRVYEGGIMKTY
jgi:hypothetical protein